MAELKKDDLAEKDFLGNVVPTAEQLANIKSLDDIYKSIASTLKDNFSKGAEQEHKKKMAQIKEEREAQIALEKMAKEKATRMKEESRLRQQINREQDQKAKQDAREKKQAADNNSEYKKLSATLNQLRNEYKELAVTGKAETREAKEKLKAIRNLDEGLKKVDATVGQHQRSVGNYANSLRGAKNALAGFGLALGGVAIARNALGIIVDFDKAVADLGAISGKTASELLPLNNQAKALGESTAFSASQVTELQIELAKLGFATQEIEKSAQPLLNFAAATGADLASAAALGGSALRAFGLEAQEMERVVSVLGVATTKTALDFSFLETGLSTVAPVAKAFGFSIEDTTALLGQLANSGFDASSAATATRNILLNLADANGALAKSLGRPIKGADDLAGALAELQAKGIDLGEALELTDKRSVAAFQTFLDGSGSLVELRDSITDVSGELTDMADKRLDSVHGATLLVQSAWEGLILKLNEGTGASNMLKGALQFIASNMETIAKVVGIALATFLAWKTTIIATRVATTAYNSALALMSVGFGKANVGIVTADKSMKAFNTTTKANPLGLLISLLVLAVGSFVSFRDSASDAEKAQRKLNEAISDGAELGAKAVGAIAKAGADRLAQIEREAEIMRNNGEEEAKVQAFVLAERKKVHDQTIEFSEAQMQKVEDQRAAFVKAKRNEIKEIERKIELEREELDIAGQYGADTGANLRRIDQLKEEKTLIEERILLTNKKSAAVIQELRNEINATTDANEVLESEDKKHQRELTKEQLAEAKKRAHDLSQLRRRAEDLEDQRIEDEFERREQQLWRAYEREIEVLKGNEAEKVRLRKELQRKLDNDLLELEKEKEKKSMQVALDALAEREKAIEDARKKQEDEDEQAFQAELKLLEKRSKEQQLITLQNAELTADEVEKLEKQRQMELLEEKIKLQKAYGKETLDLEIELQQMKNDLNKKEVKTVQEHVANLIEVSKALSDFWDKQFDKRIEQLQKEEDRALAQADFYRELAAQGNIDAEQSIIEQQRIAEAAKREREKAEREKAKLQLITSGLATYQSKIAAGDKNPLLSTITEVTALTKFLSTLPAFFEGTEDTGNGGGLDGKGGFLSVLHPNERVVPAKDNGKLSGISNSDLADVGYKWRTGQLIDVNKRRDTSGDSFDVLPLIKKFDEINDTLKNLPNTEYNVQDVLTGAFTLVRTETKGRKIVKSSTKFRK